jgi:hypothetical protein
MKAHPTTYCTLPPVNPSGISSISRNGNPPVAWFSEPTIEEGEEPLPESSESFEDDDLLSVCFPTCSSLRPEDRGSGDVPVVDPVLNMLQAKGQGAAGVDSDEEDDEDDEDETYPYTSHSKFAPSCPRKFVRLSSPLLR